MSARRRGGQGPPAQMPFIPGAPRLGSSEGGKDMVMQLHLPRSLSSSWAMHNSAPPRLLQKPGWAASSSGGGPCTHPESLPQRRRDHKARDCPQPQRLGLTWSTQCAACPLSPLHPARPRSCSSPGWGPGGQDPGDPWRHTSSAWLPAAAQVNGTSTVGRAAPVTRDRTEPARGRTASRRGCQHPAHHPEVHVGSGA